MGLFGFTLKNHGLKAVQEDLDCLQLPDIHISLMEKERMDYYPSYDLTLTTVAWQISLLFYSVFLALDDVYSLNVHRAGALG